MNIGTLALLKTGNQFSLHFKSNGRKCTMQLFGILLAFSFKRGDIQHARPELLALEWAADCSPVRLHPEERFTEDAYEDRSILRQEAT